MDDAKIIVCRGVCQAVRATDYKDPPKVAIELKQCLQLEGYESRGRIYSVEGLCPTIDTAGGGNRPPKIMEPSGIYTGVTPKFQRGPLEGLSRTLKAVQRDAGVCILGNIYESKGQAGKLYSTDGVSPTVSGQRVNSQGWMQQGVRIRRLTPKECWRLMDFTDEDFEKAKWVMPEEAEEFLKTHPKHKGRKQYTHGQRIERMSNSQLYKQAGNSIVKSVLMAIFGEMIG